ncbi:MAG: Acetyl-CoA acetyltransferase [Microbacteriaceae bacterium]|nr:Acetyl-CoA acetyltransferase [Microbacteriaceae bacterium]
MAGTIAGAAAIVGIGETSHTRGADPAATDLSLAVDASRTAIADAGLRLDEIDGIIAPYMGPGTEELMTHVGLSGIHFGSQVRLGGASPVSAIGHAAGAIAAGLATAILVPVGWAAYSGSRARSLASVDASTPYRRAVRDLYSPYGVFAPSQVYAQMARRHMHEYGTTAEALGTIAVATRAHARLNTNALMTKSMTMDDYLASRWIVYPYRLLDCCLETDSGAAIVVTSAERARALGDRPFAVIEGAAESRPSEPEDMYNRADFFEVGLRHAAPRAWEMAGVAPSDMDFAEIYDCFTFEVLHQLEEAGFCALGEGGRFVLENGVGLGDALPVNTHGGMLSQGHALGMSHVVEAVAQLRGEAGARQVDGARIGAVTGWGDLGDGSIAILSRGTS